MMAIAMTLEHYFQRTGLPYELVAHPYADTSLAVAEQAHIPADKMVKSVILEDEAGYVVAVCPASKKISLGRLYHQINRRLRMADESEISDLIGDCVLGAVPPLGDLYGAEIVLDDSLLDESDVYIEAGDHEELIHLDADSFEQMMKHAEHASFCIPA